MDNINKALLMFKYIKEFSSLKANTIKNIDLQEWHCFLKDIPVDRRYVTINYRDSDNDDDVSENILEVYKPDLKICPVPSPSFAEWLKYGWDKINRSAEVKETLGDISKINSESLEYFNDDKKRVNDYKEWQKKRDAWVKEQKAPYAIYQLFLELYQKYITLERDSESIELMVGDGMLTDQMDGTINYPILFKRIKISFDAEANKICFADTDTDAEFYTMLFTDMGGITYGALKRITDTMYKKALHPLDRNEAYSFLKSSIRQLCPKSEFIESDNTMSDKASERIRVIANPVFFIRKRINGSSRTIDAIINNIQDTGYVPPHLIDVVGGGRINVSNDEYEEPSLPQQLAESCGEDVEILLTKEANREQLEIAKRIFKYNTVLVQGPPGTGKTHTIANLLGHFLSEGKRVLVTSQTKKALSVLKEKVAPELQNLCVAILDDSNHDMERSISNISEMLSTSNVLELSRKAAIAKRSRDSVIKSLAEIRQKIFDIKLSEFNPIAYNGESVSPTAAAKFVYENSESLSYIPGNVTAYRALPLLRDELTELYESNKTVTINDEVEISYDLPDPKEFLNPSDFRRIIVENDEALEDIGRISVNMNYNIDDGSDEESITIKANDRTIHIYCPSVNGFDMLDDYLDSCPPFKEWMIYAAIDGRRGGGYAALWQTLIDLIKSTASYSDSLVEELFGITVTIDESADDEVLTKELPVMSELYSKKAAINKIQRLIDKNIEIVENAVSINGKPPRTGKECDIALRYLQLADKRKECAKYWDKLIATHEMPTFFELDSERPEHVACNILNDIERYLCWYQNEYAKLQAYMIDAGINETELFGGNQLDSESEQTRKTLTTINVMLPQIVKMTQKYLRVFVNERFVENAFKDVMSGSRKYSDVCKQIQAAYTARDADLYDNAYSMLEGVYKKHVILDRRNKLLDKIREVAPEWSDEISNRVGVHGKSEVPSDIEEAWRWKQYSTIISELTNLPFEELQKQNAALSANYRKKTAELAELCAWYHLLKKAENDPEMRSALVGWKLTMGKVGRGTGKTAPMYREEARKLMIKCQDAVPAWIMPMNRVMESFVPGKNSFDIIIVDEASQSDITALAVTYMAKKVIVVGDDKQVSPLSIGIDTDRMNQLSEGTIKDIIPNWQLYIGNSSIYDIVSTVYPALMLREHFRCVPDIIGYSNKTSYDYKIKPLREAGSSNLLPAVVNYRVNGHRSKEVNVVEAETIVALLQACMQIKEYEDKTFGVITLHGVEQARLIEKMILSRIDTAIYEKRKILCGNPAQFQGDERDVIFLSMVDSNDNAANIENRGPLSLMTEGANQSMKKRYNVAVSRAKDQLWVVHSLDKGIDLKDGDLRKTLLEYSMNPAAFSEQVDKIKSYAESPFEEAVGKALVAQGYEIVQQWNVGAYRIDMVVIDGEKKIAIECDGERWHSEESKVREDMERQTILERIGWKFIRIRGSEYYRNPDAAMSRVYKELDELGIHTQKIDVTESNSNYDLLNRVKTIASEIQAKKSENIEEDVSVINDDDKEP